MKRLAKSVATHIPYNFGVGVEVNGNKIRFYTYDDNGGILGEREYDFDAPPLGFKELQARNNIYVVATSQGFIEPLYNKMLASAMDKASGYKHIVKLSKPVIGQIYIPFSDSPISDCSLRITYTPEKGYQSNVDLDEDVQDFGAFFNAVSPTLRSTEVEPGKWVVQLVDGDGTDIQKAGVKIYAKTDGGQLSFTERATNAGGNATFKLLPTGFDPGDVATVEFGFKWVSNLANGTLAA